MSETFKVKVERREYHDGSVSLFAPSLGNFYIFLDDYDGRWSFTEPYSVRVREGRWDTRDEAEAAVNNEIDRIIREE